MTIHWMEEVVRQRKALSLIMLCGTREEQAGGILFMVPEASYLAGTDFPVRT